MSKSRPDWQIAFLHALIGGLLIVLVALQILTVGASFLGLRIENINHDVAFQFIAEIVQIVVIWFGVKFSSELILKRYKFHSAKKVLNLSTLFVAIYLLIAFAMGFISLPPILSPISLPIILIFAIGAPISCLVFYFETKKTLKAVEESQESGISKIKLSRAIENNLGKFIVLVIYVATVFISPLNFFTPASQALLTDIQSQVVANNADTFFRQYINSLHMDNLNQVSSVLSDQMRQTTATSSLQTLASYFASTTNQIVVIGGNYKKAQVIGGYTNETYDVYYQIQNNDPVNKYVVVEFQAENTGNGLQIYDTYVKYETQSIQQLDQFSFTTQGIYLILSLLIPLFIIFTAFRYLNKAHKPGWVLFLVILFLTLYISVSGSNYGGQLGFSGFMIKAGPWGPWVFFTPIPFGAIYYWIRRKHYENASEETI